MRPSDHRMNGCKRIWGRLRRWYRLTTETEESLTGEDIIDAWEVGAQLHVNVADEVVVDMASSLGEGENTFGGC